MPRIPAFWPLLIPTAATAFATVLVADPTYRFPLTALLLPLFLRSAATVHGVARSGSGAIITALFQALGFAGFAVGWLLMFAILVFIVGTGALAIASADMVKIALLLAALGFVVAAWFWWPWYARDSLASWPSTGVRIATASGNRWEKVYLAWRMQALATAKGVRWRGFGGTAAVIGLVMGLTTLGAYPGVLPRLAEAACILLLPVVHWLIVREAHALCESWADGQRQLGCT